MLSNMVLSSFVVYGRLFRSVDVFDFLTFFFAFFTIGESTTILNCIVAVVLNVERGITQFKLFLNEGQTREFTEHDTGIVPLKNWLIFVTGNLRITNLDRSSIIIGAL